MKSETNGKASPSMRIRHFNIKYFLITDLITRNEMTLQFYPIDSMIANYMTKPLIGKSLSNFARLS